VDSLPDLLERFPGFFDDTEARETLSHRIDAVCDTRESTDIPTRGTFVDVGYEFARREVASSFSYSRWFGEAIHHLPLFSGRAVTVFRVAGSAVNGSGIPFYRLSTLGGVRTLRGFGEGRFYDENAVVGNIEESINFRDMNLYQVKCRLQLVGFIDSGAVFGDVESLDEALLQTVAGGGVRFIVPESDLVASIDIGIGREGPAAFILLGYPF
jgi:outer membrane protein assembly factor BamA